MSLATAILTTLAMLWHTVAGCCAHHSHYPTLGIGDIEPPAAVADHDHAAMLGQELHRDDHHCHHHHLPHATSHSENSDGHQQESGECSHKDCVFSVSTSDGSVSLTKLIGSLYFDTRCILSFDEDLGISGERETIEARPFAPEMRPVYLRYQSFLI
ncbi:hypothetical protein GC197_02670 [bacterium]|nr:hypothetical protein [bacterium]